MSRLIDTDIAIHLRDSDGWAAAACRAMVELVDYSRSRLLDRMIAATAIVHGHRLITANGADFQDIPNLKLEIWMS